MAQQITLNKKRLTKKQVQELIEQGAVIDIEITNEYHNNVADMVDIYRLPDGNYLFVFKDAGLKGKGDIWPKEYVEKTVSKIKKEKEHPSLKGLSNIEHWFYFSKTKKDFPNQIQFLISELFKKLELSEKVIDYSYDSLDLLSEKLNKLNEEFVQNELYDGIVAYLGEVLIKKIDGKWSFNSTVTEPIHPLIITQHKAVWYDPVTPIWEDLTDVRGFNLRKNLVSEIRSHQLDRNSLIKKKGV